MAKTTSDSILGVIQKFLKILKFVLTLLGGGLQSPNAFLVSY